jgi:hypothetical protein
VNRINVFYVSPLELISLLVMLYRRSYKFCLKRRLRIRTLQYRPTNNISEIYDSVDPEVVLHILVHKVIIFLFVFGLNQVYYFLYKLSRIT